MPAPSSPSSSSSSSSSSTLFVKHSSSKSSSKKRSRPSASASASASPKLTAAVATSSSQAAKIEAAAAAKTLITASGRRLLKMSSFAFKDLKVQQKLLDQDQQQREEERSRRHTLSRDITAPTPASSVSEDSDCSSSKSQQQADSASSASVAVDVTYTSSTTTTTVTTTTASVHIISDANNKQELSPKNKSRKFSILSSLRRNNFIGNPTASFALEKKQDEEHKSHNDAEEPATFKSSIVKYFQKDTATPTFAMEFPGGEESREKVRRQVENNSSKSSKAATQRRKSNMFRTTVSMLERSQYVTEVDFPSTRRIDLYKDSSGDLDLYHVDDDFDDDYEMREFGAHFFDN